MYDNGHTAICRSNIANRVCLGDASSSTEFISVCADLSKIFYGKYTGTPPLSTNNGEIPVSGYDMRNMDASCPHIAFLHTDVPMIFCYRKIGTVHCRRAGRQWCGQSGVETNLFNRIVTHEFMEIYRTKPRIRLSQVVRYGRKFIEVTFDGDDLRLPLSKEEGVQLVGGKAYLPEETFVLADFFDRYVKMAFIDYSAIKGCTPRKDEDERPPLPDGYLEKLQQVRYSDHTVRVYTSYFRDFQQHFKGRDVRTVTPGEINDYLLYLIHEKNISSCQQNQRINAIKFYYEKVLGQERRCYKVNRAKREKTLPDVLSKEEVKSILSVVVTDLRIWCMFSVLYSAGLRISELLALKPDDINVSRSVIRVRQGKGKKDRYTLLSKPLVVKLTEYNRIYRPKVWFFERRPGEPFTESIVSKRLKAAAREAGITKRIYPHLMRHSFATHLLEQGTDIKIVKELMGHNNIKTTEMYVHIADTYMSKVKSPLDDILEEERM